MDADALRRLAYLKTAIPQARAEGANVRAAEYEVEAFALEMGLRIDRTLDYVRTLQRLPNLHPDLRATASAVERSLTTEVNP